MTVYIETNRLKLRDWQDEDLQPFQQLNANRQVRQFFSEFIKLSKNSIGF